MMGARHAEFALGFWLLMSPFVFGHTGLFGILVHDLVVGTVVLVLSLLCYVPRLSRAHLVTGLFALELIVLGWWAAANAEPPASPPAWSQNHVMVGLTLAMLVLVPTRAARPPKGWLPHVADDR